uniref:Uncharacterized protein n=1 Tax=Arundo donax TaxID=35708 RepID=A0A0A9GWM6_ARUDO
MEVKATVLGILEKQSSCKITSIHMIIIFVVHGVKK